MRQRSRQQRRLAEEAHFVFCGRGVAHIEMHRSYNLQHFHVDEALSVLAHAEIGVLVCA